MHHYLTQGKQKLLNFAKILRVRGTGSECRDWAQRAGRDEHEQNRFWIFSLQNIIYVLVTVTLCAQEWITKKKKKRERILERRGFSPYFNLPGKPEEDIIKTKNIPCKVMLFCTCLQLYANFDRLRDIIFVGYISHCSNGLTESVFISFSIVIFIAASY